jgi:flagellar biosynthesis protein FlhB
MKIVFMTLSIFIVLGILDWVVEKYNLQKNLMMSHQDLADEYKETVGNPHTLSARRRERLNILNSSLNRVGEAKVVVANPTHISVALDYEPGTHDLPYVIAMGVDHDALRIREKAKELGIPVIVNVPLARGLYRDCEEDEYIKREHLELAAQVFRVVLQLGEEKSR